MQMTRHDKHGSIGARARAMRPTNTHKAAMVGHEFRKQASAKKWRHKTELVSAATELCDETM